ncbi:hypothetical protein DFH06DRAFT_1195332 [Mycena polygramma]|nr:hypothetical protein DFH06DRAFT_1195332 [Mycena polygramma]
MHVYVSPEYMSRCFLGFVFFSASWYAYASRCPSLIVLLLVSCLLYRCYPLLYHSFFVASFRFSLSQLSTISLALTYSLPHAAVASFIVYIFFVCLQITVRPVFIVAVPPQSCN